MRKIVSPPPPLFTTEMKTITVPINGVSPEGQIQLGKHLDRWGLPQLPDTWDWSWKVTRGEYAGTLPKRISRYYYKEHKAKLTQEQLTEIGNVASQFVFSQDKFFVDFTNDINWKPTEFGETSDSCFWSCRRWAKNMIYENGGKAMRFYRGANKSYGGFGRVWIIPRTTDKDNNEELMFNGYGLDLLSMVRIYSHFMGLIYEKILLLNNGSWEKMLWVNGGKGYIVGPSSIITSITSGTCVDPLLREWQSCGYCQVGKPEDRSINLCDQLPICFTCADRHHTVCDDCTHMLMTQHLYYMNLSVNHNEEDRNVCYSCMETKYNKCYHCDCWEYKNISHTINNRQVCHKCYKEKYNVCACCSSKCLKTELHDMGEGIILCHICYPKDKNKQKKGRNKISMDNIMDYHIFNYPRNHMHTIINWTTS